MSEHDTERQKVSVEHRGKKLEYFARELGYFEFQELEEQISEMPDKTDVQKNKRGLALMKLVTVASIENEDGNPALTMDSLRKLHRDIARPLSDAAMKAQGIDMDKIRKEAMRAKENGEVVLDIEDSPEGNG